MDSVRVTSKAPVGRRLALFGLFVSRLMAFCILYFAPALAYVPGAPGTVPVPVPVAVAVGVGERVVDSPSAESLDPKHEKDHDETRESERGRGHSRG